MSTTSLKLPDELKQKIAELAPGVAQTPHAYMVEAIAEKVARDEKRRDLLESAERSAADFRRTGAAYSHDEAMRYFTEKAEGRTPKRPMPRKVPRAER